MWPFPGCAEWGLCLAVVHGLHVVVAFLAVEHRVQGRQAQ